MRHYLPISVSDIVAAVVKAGFVTSVRAPTSGKTAAAYFLLFTIPLFYMVMGPMIGLPVLEFRAERYLA